LVTLAVTNRQGFVAPTQTALGDGAAYIWRSAAGCFPKAILVLDWWQLRRAQHQALQAARPDQQDRAPWQEHLTARLNASNVPAALVLLQELAQSTPHSALTAWPAYFSTLAPQIPSYDTRGPASARIGRGGSEKGVDLLVNQRLKGKHGVRWWHNHVEGGYRLMPGPP
jgi:hypothetical protein